MGAGRTRPAGRGCRVLVYQNIVKVPVRAFWWEFNLPLVVVIVATAVVTLVIEALVRMILSWRRRRPRRGPRPSPHRNGERR